MAWEEAMIFQAETMCKPLHKHFSSASLYELHLYLSQQGLRKPKADWDRFIKAVRTKSYLKELQKHYLKLKALWNGPELPVFLFPIDMDNYRLIENLNHKNGVTFRTCILLFFDESLPLSATKALLTHEYNHGCRLFYQDNDEESVTLLESMVMEGLAESAVRRHLGKEELAPWTNLYTKEQCQRWWQVSLAEKRQIQGRRYHDHFMYGGHSLPKMVGYCIGYYIVRDFYKLTGSSYKDVDVFALSPDEILTLSKWGS